MQNKFYFFLPDVNGGVASIINNLIAFNDPTFLYTVIAYNDKRHKRHAADFNNATAIQIKKINFNSHDNLFCTVKKLRNTINDSDPILIATDAPELQMVQISKLDAKVIFIVMGDFEHYYKLAVQHQFVINRYIAISKEIYSNLVKHLPGRKHDIVQAYFPTPDEDIKKKTTQYPGLRILYVARLESSKNPLLLPDIDSILKENGVAVHWTVVGSGPLETALKEKVKQAGFTNFSFTGMITNDQLHELYKEHDTLVMTSFIEGLPVSLIEAMKSGLVPVVSDIPGGIREVVQHNKNGFLCNVNDAGSFAAAIIALQRDTDFQKGLTLAAIDSVKIQFNEKKNRHQYFELIQSAPFKKRMKKFGFSMNRLDNKWIPSFIVRYLRDNKPGHHVQ